jgi:hypothetical protein
MSGLDKANGVAILNSRRPGSASRATVTWRTAQFADGRVGRAANGRTHLLTDLGHFRVIFGGPRRTGVLLFEFLQLLVLGRVIGLDGLGILEAAERLERSKVVPYHGLPGQ